MTELQTWDYQTSVEKVRPMVMNWKNLTVDIVRELYQARGALSSQGARTDLVPNGTKLGWRKYLDDIGMSKSNAHRWLERYIPEQDKLLTSEEHEQLLIEQKKAVQLEKQNQENLIRQKTATGIEPPEWNDDLEKEYQKRIDDESYEKRKQEAFKKNAEKYSEKPAPGKKHDDAFWENVTQAAEEFIQQEEKHSHLNLSTYAETGLQTEMFTAIEKYLNTFDGVSGQLEAAHNLIKKLKMIVSDLQRESV